MTSSEITVIAVDGFSGTMLHPGDSDYDEARHVHNALIDRRPSVILRCTSADDVAAVVTTARRDGLAFTVRAGGHGVDGAAVADGAMCIDLRGMKRIEIDPVGRTARVEAGVLWGELDAATQVHGLALTGGRVSTTGVAGTTLGSGSGWIERQFGYTCDSLLSAEVVTADGRRVNASERENRGLFWGLRGGSGNFGIVTAFHFRLHVLGPIVLGGVILHPAERAGDVVRHYRDIVATAPDTLGGGLLFLTAPDAKDVPEPLRGRPAVGIVCCYAGPPDEGGDVVTRLRALGPPALDTVQPMPYVALQRQFDDSHPAGLLNHWSADFLTELPDEAVDVLVEHVARTESPHSTVLLTPGGGAIGRTRDSATALGDRTAAWNIHYMSAWSDPADTGRNVGYTRSLAAAMKPWATGRVFLNYIGDEGQGRVAAAYGPEKYARLAALKKTWDRTNVFRHNHNIPPA